MIVDPNGRMSEFMSMRDAVKELARRHNQGEKSVVAIGGSRAALEDLRRRNEEIQAKYLKRKADQRERQAQRDK